MSRHSFTIVSMNKKTGPIPVTRSQSNTCPDTCGLKDACYAKYGPSAIHWRKLDKAGLSFKELIDKIKSIPNGRLWRHNEAGDLPGINRRIDKKKLDALIEANKGKRGFTYTHKPLTVLNLSLIRKANKEGFTVNVSCDSLEEVDRLPEDIPAVIVLKEMIKKTPGGRSIVQCPNETHNMQCVDCQLCAKQRKAVVAFTPHGSGKNKF